MSKQNKKLLAEIQNGLKQVDEGIAQLEMLEVKVENASTISIKEKYRQDMKREIKRLQRLRDIFRQNVNNPAIVEQHRLVEARKRIETEMEKFRDHEKEYKSKRPTKAAMLVDAEVKGKFNYGSGSSFDGEYGDEGNELGEDDDDDLNEESDVQDIVIDKQWLANFVTETLRTIMNKYDSELDKIQNKKTKGGQKKNRDKINALKAKKSHFQQIKDRAEELQISMDYLEPGKIRQLRIQSKQLSSQSDEEPVRSSVLQEIDQLIELSEQNRRSLPSNNANNQLQQTNSEGGRVALESLDVAGSEDIVDDERILSSLRIGNILDAQDYLGTWHLSIVIDDGTSATNDQPSESKTLHFLPFMKANRDEVFSTEDQARLAPAFSKQDAAGEPQQQLQTLQTYLENHLRKTGQNPATIQQNKQLRQQQQMQQLAKEESKSGAAARKKADTNTRANQQQNAPTSTERNINGSGLQLQKGKTGNPPPSKVTGGKNTTQQDDHKNKNRMATNANQMIDQQAAYSNQEGHAERLGDPSQSVQLVGKQSANNEAMPQLFQDMPEFGGQFLMGGGVDGAFKGGSDLQLNAAGLKDSSVLLQNQGSLGSFNGVTQQSPTVVKDTSLSERKHNLDLLETSFKNILTKQDQEVIDPKQPVSVWEEHDYPRVPLYNRKENFSKFDIETLFFAFYYQQGTYQQYLAAVELKKKNWKFVKKFETWFKKVESEPGSSTQQTGSNSANATTVGADGGATMPSESNEAAATSTSQQKDVGKYIFFDFENGWQQLVRDDFELDLSQIENELVVQPAATATQAAGASSAGVTGPILSNNPVTASTTAGYTGAPSGATNAGSGAPLRTSHAQ